MASSYHQHFQCDHIEANLHFDGIMLCSSIFILFSVDTCTVPGVPNSDLSSQFTIDYDTAVTYTCNTGYSNTGGQLTRTCLAGGSLTGDPPVCTSK